MHQLALEACVLIALYRCAGKWISIEQISARLGVARERALAVCTELSAHAQVRHCVVEGHDMYASCVGKRTDVSGMATSPFGFAEHAATQAVHSRG